MIRRRFLWGGAAGAAAAAGAGAWLGFRSGTALPEPPGALASLDRVGFGVLALFAGRVLDFPGADPIRTAWLADGSLRRVSPEARADLRLGLALLENGLSGLLTRGSWRLFSELEDTAKDEAIRRWGHSDQNQLRGASNALRKLCLAVHYAELQNALATGYPGPPLDKPEPAPITARGAIAAPWRPR